MSSHIITFFLSLNSNTFYLNPNCFTWESYTKNVYAQLRVTTQNCARLRVIARKSPGHDSIYACLLNLHFLRFISRINIEIFKSFFFLFFIKSTGLPRF